MFTVLWLFMVNSTGSTSDLVTNCYFLSRFCTLNNHCFVTLFSSFSIGKVNKYLIDFFEDKKVRKIALENGITGKDFLLVLIIITDNNIYKL